MKIKIPAKKIVLLVIINIIALTILLFTANYIIYKFFYNKLEMIGWHSDEPIPYTIERMNLTYEKIKEIYTFREPVGLDYKNKGIIMFGCSYGYGSPLNINQTLQYKLSHILKRPVYNFSSPGQSPQFALIDIRNHKIDDIIKNSEYVIIVTIGEHVWRVHTNSNGFWTKGVWPRYDIKTNKGKKELVLHNCRFPFIEGSYLYKYIQKTFFAKILNESSSEKVQNYMFDYIKLHYETIMDELKAINPDIKIINIIYHDEEETEYFTSSPRWKELEDEGYIIVDVYKYIPHLAEEKYRVPNDGHPTEEAWDDVRNLLVNDLKLFDK